MITAFLSFSYSYQFGGLVRSHGYMKDQTEKLYFFGKDSFNELQVLCVCYMHRPKDLITDLTFCKYGMYSRLMVGTRLDCKKLNVGVKLSLMLVCIEHNWPHICFDGLDLFSAS